MKVTISLSCVKCGHHWDQTTNKNETVVAECPRCKKTKKK